MDEMVGEPEKDSWSRRRTFMFAVSLFCAVIIGYSLLNNMDTKVAETAVTMAFFTLMSITGGYTFGAAWEDISKHKIKSR